VGIAQNVDNAARRRAIADGDTINVPAARLEQGLERRARRCIFSSGEVE
jgi:hypothetical protein